MFHRLPILKGENLFVRILESVDLKSYKIEKKNTIDIILKDENGKVEGLDIGICKKNVVE